jgi:uncharacterized protein YjiS (DUF1127 family)
MSQSFVLRSSPAKFGARSRLPMLSGWFHAINIWLARRQGWQDLNLLDDRMLKDLGITREQVIRKAGQSY